MEPPNSSHQGRLQWFGHTDRGKVRKNNEDSFLCLQFDAQEVRYLGKIGDASLEMGDFVFAVGDGMGGAMAGEFASRIAVESITRLLPAAFRRSVGFAAGFEDILGELFEQIHTALMRLGRNYEECAGMGTTLSMCLFAPGKLFFAHIGDSRIYYLPAGGTELRQISHDDSYVGWMFRNGKINEREARNHPRRTVLQKALGAGHQYVDPQVGTVLYEPGDRFLLCTDGLIDGLFHDQLTEFLARPAPGAESDPAKRLVAASLERSGKDNTTVVVVEVL